MGVSLVLSWTEQARSSTFALLVQSKRAPSVTSLRLPSWLFGSPKQAEIVDGRAAERTAARRRDRSSLLQHLACRLAHGGLRIIGAFALARPTSHAHATPS